ncbi:unnamed protein product [Acanthoscelides obtectus]|uniref:Chitin-binding type-2 domain-containing protein n=1 Tax=Acanthoscelides obtectus TaxID=200917 RepID=A0A9P0PMD5_ACAOB|nr:unnamed protein product [Acanthoscelides obtectus]CAK1671120.1 hypothetical protein AOBTE_LOCUS28067 [Acanthoscelides obtectus]
MKWVLLVLSLLFFTMTHTSEAFGLLPCSEKGFVCMGRYQFYQCVRNSDGLHLANIMNCPKGMICSDEDNLECDREDGANLISKTDK